MFILLNSELPAFCERLHAPSDVELFNTLSALVLAAPALLGLWLRRRTGSRDPGHLLLIVLAALLPLSQLVVHAWRPYWAGIVDQLPLGLFVVVFFIGLFWRQLGLPLHVALLNVVGICLLTLLFRRILPHTPAAEAALVAPPVLLYLLTGAILLGQGRDEDRHPAETWTHRGITPAEKRRSGHLLIAAGLVLVPALIARFQDLAQCNEVAIGLHWLWHIGGAVVGSLMMLAAMGRNGR